MDTFTVATAVPVQFVVEYHVIVAEQLPPAGSVQSHAEQSRVSDALP
ncbi:Hypothetical protein A7982_03474 [Minicystis rosea]|nr:Hypothetical protein A7982_03474 [Minicystis rosea]